MGYPDSEVEVGVVLAESTGLDSGSLEADAMTNAVGVGTAVMLVGLTAILIPLIASQPDL